VTVGTTGPMGSGLPQFGFPRRFAIATSGSFPRGVGGRKHFSLPRFRGTPPPRTVLRKFFSPLGLGVDFECKFLILKGQYAKALDSVVCGAKPPKEEGPLAATLALLLVFLFYQIEAN
jgi:hypothetical protein